MAGTRVSEPPPAASQGAHQQGAGIESEEPGLKPGDTGIPSGILTTTPNAQPNIVTLRGEHTNVNLIIIV